MSCDVLSVSDVHFLRWLISDRLREVRLERFGPHGVAELAQLIGIDSQEWASYEEGAMVPAEVLLAFIDVTACSPRWLLMGSGDKYQQQVASRDEQAPNGWDAGAQGMADRALACACLAN
jgi:hypothetical protein